MAPGRSQDRHIFQTLTSGAVRRKVTRSSHLPDSFLWGHKEEGHKIVTSSRLFPLGLREVNKKSRIREYFLFLGSRKRRQSRNLWPTSARVSAA
ncbi:hypothetical protein RRG08_021080 [Elysia crispata]|uniref:Uncharacterized protein n=1 Tax=Elysia crispata TaxID=231223 RepID=A0AAE1CWR0_9GAST|nr:hypothetical protein RRG08_021080 [Elysia crispata]